MTTIRFEILHPNGLSNSAIIDGEEALIGSGSHCDVRLSIDQAPMELLKISHQGNILRGQVKSAAREVTLDGRPFSEGTLGTRATLGIGHTRLLVTLATDTGNARASTRAQLRRVSSAVALTACALIVYSQLRPGAPQRQDPSFDIELFAPPPSACPHKNQEEARAYAAEQLDLANGKRERMPFVAQEGLAAAMLYHTSATCYRQAGAVEEASEAAESAQTIERDLANDFRVRCLRLSRLLTLEDYEFAQRDLAALSALAQGKRGRAGVWLRKVTAQLKARGVL